MEGVRPSIEDPLLLTVQRHTSLDGSVSSRLVRLGSDVGFGYYGTFVGPEAMAWSR